MTSTTNNGETLSPVRRLADLADMPSWAPNRAREFWQFVRDGADLSSEDEALALAELDHPEFALLWAREKELPDRFKVGGLNPRFHVLLHRVVENQLLTNNPPEARVALAHLLELGVDRHAAIHLMMDGLVKDIQTAVQQIMPTGYVPFLGRLSRARVGAGGPRSKIGRNDPCPCGSGKKYKRCCGADGPGPIIDLNSAPMLLGDTFWMDSDLDDLPQSHPLVALDNLMAVALALEEEGLIDLTRDAYARIVAAAAPLGQDVLDKALQEQLEFTAEYPE